MASKVMFEDEFMDLQSGLVSLVLEALEDRPPVDDIYIYESVEEDSYAFNAFCRKGGEVVSIGRLVDDGDLVRQLLRLGIDDLSTLPDICARYGRECPTQVRGHYTVATGAFKWDARYDPIRSAPENPREQFEVLDDWKRAVLDGTDALA